LRYIDRLHIEREHLGTVGDYVHVGRRNGRNRIYAIALFSSALFANVVQNSRVHIQGGRNLGRARRYARKFYEQRPVLQTYSNITRGSRHVDKNHEFLIRVYYVDDFRMVRVPVIRKRNNGERGNKRPPLREYSEFSIPGDHAIVQPSLRVVLRRRSNSDDIFGIFDPEHRHPVNFSRLRFHRAIRNARKSVRRRRPRPGHTAR